MKRCREIEDCLAVLNRHDTSSCEGTTVSYSINLVENRRFRIPRAQKVRVQRVDGFRRVDRPASRNQRLGCHKASKGPQSRLIGLTTTKNVDFNHFQIEKRQQFIEVSVCFRNGDGRTVHQVV